MKNIEFLKMHGLGNDFVILDERTQHIENKQELSRKLGDRRFGVGCDQIIFVSHSMQGAAAYMGIFNPDGSESGACGNATRCVADILMRDSGLDQCSIETKAGILLCQRAEENCITVDMGAPKLEWQSIPLAQSSDTLNLPLGGEGVSHPVAVNMGNPHCVFFVDDLDRVDVARIGPRFERDSLFPERTNVEFAEILDRHHIRMRVWERGAGITLACGSGACATAVAAIRRGLTNRKVTISMDGGDLVLEWKESDGHVYMTGPVAYVFRGTLFAI